MRNDSCCSSVMINGTVTRKCILVCRIRMKKGGRGGKGTHSMANTSSQAQKRNAANHHTLENPMHNAFCIRLHASFRALDILRVHIKPPPGLHSTLVPTLVPVGISKDGKGSGARELAMHVRVEPWPGFQEIPA